MGETHHHRVPKWMMAEYDKKLAGMSEKNRNFVKEVMAEQYMEKTAGQRGMKVTVSPADKGMRGGPDADMRSRSGQSVRGEAKAENSKLSRGQRNSVKTLQTDPEKAEKGIGQFRKASGLDRQAAQQTRGALERGNSVRYEVSRTRATPNGFETKVSGRNYALPQTGTQGGPVTTTRNPQAIGSGFKPAGETTSALRANVRATGTRSATGGSSPSRAAGSPSGRPTTGGLGGPAGGSKPSGGIGGTRGGSRPGGGIGGGLGGHKPGGSPGGGPGGGM
ncbi:MAG TPA: hypothetical protein VMU81_14990 [Acetobacteraceae bacterium]|nr:hypothetical protein [Acetobacteraceae bacterium]